MEGVGLLSTASSDVQWIVVKGISDVADEVRTAEADRQRACGNAATFVLGALRG